MFAAVLAGLGFLCTVVNGLFARSSAPTWADLSGGEQLLIWIGTLGALVYCAGALYYLVRYWRARHGATRTVRVCAICLSVIGVVLVGAGLVQWTTWPFDMAFYYQRQEVAETVADGLPYDGTFRIGCFTIRGELQTDAGPLFEMPTLRHVGYLHRPGGPPPSETWMVITGSRQAAVRYRVRFRQVHALPADWYAVVCDWTEEPIAAAADSPE